MKIGAILLLLLWCAGQARAGPDRVTAPGPVDLPASRATFYCQTTASDWIAYNASSSFDSEIADDIPDSYAAFDVNEVTVYVAQWEAGWMNPTSITVNFYDASCPPSQTADYSFEVPYGSCTATLVYDLYWTVYSVLIPLPQAVSIGTATSIGAIVNQNWGPVPPYCGLVISDAIQDCDANWDGEIWGCPRWCSLGYDLAYCLGYEGGIGHDELGACCFADGHCEIRYQPSCEQDGGEYQGDNVGCEPNPCVPTAVKCTTWGRVRGDYR